MFNQFDQLEQQRPPQDELRVELDLRSKAESQEPQWLDQPPKSLKPKRKQSPKVEPLNLQPQSPVLLQLSSLLEISKRRLKKGLPQIIKQEAQHLEHKVFASQTNVNEKDYLQSIYAHTNQNKYVRNEIYDTLRGAQVSVQKDIKGKGAPALQHRRIPRNKDELRDLEKEDYYRLLRIKEGEVKNKVGSLRQQLDQEYIKSRLRNRVEEMGGGADPNYFSIDHPRTKEAQHFVKDIQRRRNEQHRQYGLMMSARKQQLQYQKQMQSQRKEMQRMERRTKLKEYYQSKLQQRLQMKQIERQKKEEFKEWIKAYQKERPLEIEREEQYKMKVLIPQLQERHKKLMTIKAQHKPIDPEEIAEHEMKYLQFKKDDSIRKRAEIELAQEEDQMRKDEVADKFYKGRYRLMVLEQMLDEKYPLAAKDIEQSKKDRIKAYDSIVRQSLKSHPERVAGQTLEAQSTSNQKFIRRVRKLNGSLTISHQGVKQIQEGQQEETIPEYASDRPANRKQSQQLDAYKQGLKNLAIVKNQVRQRLAKEEEQKPKINLIQQKQIVKPKGFLEIQREKRLNRKKQKEPRELSREKQMESTDVTGNQQIKAIKVRAQHLDQKLKRHETKLKNGKQDNFQDKAQVEEEYMSAIKKKLQILSQFN